MFPTLVSEPIPAAPSRTPQGTLKLDVATLEAQIAASRAPTVRMPAPIGGTMVMQLEPIASGSEPVSDAELARYVRVSAALASAQDRNVTLTAYGLSLQAWVDWSSRMGRRLGCDAALRARYSRLLHDAISRNG